MGLWIRAVFESLFGRKTAKNADCVQEIPEAELPDSEKNPEVSSEAENGETDAGIDFREEQEKSDKTVKKAKPRQWRSTRDFRMPE